MPSVNPLTAWSAVLKHDRRFDGTFVYAVSSTNVYCRPSCPSRRPARQNVKFFISSQQAEAAGFRACLRCQPQSAYGSRTERLVEQVRRYLDEQADEPATLKHLATLVQMSPFHLQRAFSRVVGLSPKAYQDAKRMERFTNSLKRGDTVTNATYEAGFGSSSRVSERASQHLGMTPSAFRSGGAGVTLRYATAPTAAGRMLIAVTERGLVSVSLGDSEASLAAQLKREYPNAVLRRDPEGLKQQLHVLLQCLNGQAVTEQLPLDVNATTFQRKVWRVLQQIPRGSTRTYWEIAQAVGQPTASRAVARACATNPVALAIPCHRVVREDGSPASYRWGLQRKKRLLALERK